MEKLAVQLKEAHDNTRDRVYAEKIEYQKRLKGLNILSNIGLVVCLELFVAGFLGLDLFGHSEYRFLGETIGIVLALFILVKRKITKQKYDGYLGIVKFNLAHLDCYVDWDDVVDNYGVDNCESVLKHYEEEDIWGNPFIGRIVGKFDRYVFTNRAVEYKDGEYVSVKQEHAHPFIDMRCSDFGGEECYPLLLHLPKDTQELLNRISPKQRKYTPD